MKSLHCGDAPYRLELKCGGQITARAIVIASGRVSPACARKSRPFRRTWRLPY
ncbi:MAG: Thioredoxin reductase (EC [uncultured Paraburkholderia sp.]|nr:MAG: Thioredoxin reductase (EC [uncultured Paraburkholderia sp.]CAH2913349.1 MAG: Thioredoxin reductase (EC [uncultured Paraburkholderia sp.]